MQQGHTTHSNKTPLNKAFKHFQRIQWENAMCKLVSTVFLWIFCDSHANMDCIKDVPITPVFSFVRWKFIVKIENDFEFSTAECIKRLTQSQPETKAIWIVWVEIFSRRHGMTINIIIIIMTTIIEWSACGNRKVTHSGRIRLNCCLGPIQCRSTFIRRLFGFRFIVCPAHQNHRQFYRLSMQ